MELPVAEAARSKA